MELSDVKRGTIDHTPIAKIEVGDEIHANYNSDKGNELRAELDRRMEQPFIVQYETGMIKSTKFENDGLDESDETVYWRMAIGELFQGDFQRLLQNPDSKSMEYENEEDGVAGVCTTNYFGEKGTHDDEMRVRKTRRYDECKLRPHYFHSSIRGSACSRSENEPYQAKGQVFYRIKKMTIEEIHGLGDVTLHPFGMDGQYVESLINQRLKLKSIETESYDHLHGWDKVIKKTSLSFASSYDNRDPSELHLSDLKKSHYFNRYGGKKDFQQISEVLENFPSEESDEKTQYKQILKLMDNFKQFSYEDFVQFFKFIDSNTVNYRRQVAFQVLPFVGTNPTIVFLLRRIEDGTIHPITAMSFLVTLPFHVKEPSPALLQAFWRYLNNGLVKNDELLYQSSWLAFGTLLYRSCVKDYFTPHSTYLETYVDGQTCDIYLQELATAFHTVTIPERKSVLIRAIKNSRMQSNRTGDLLRDVIQGNYQPTLRREALITVLEIYGHHHTSTDDHYRKTLYSLSEEVFIDKSQDFTVRMAAFEVIAKLAPSEEQADKIVRNYLEEEQNQKVAGFMYSTLEFLAHSNASCDQNLTSWYADALSSVDPIETDPLMHGYNKYYSYFNEHYNVGFTSHMQMIASNDSVIPLGLYYRHIENMLGYNLEKIEFGSFLSDTSFLNNKLMETFASNLRGSYSPYDAEWKHLKNVKKNPEPSIPEAALYVSTYDQDVLELYFNRLLAAGTLVGMKSPDTVEERRLYGVNPYIKTTQMKFNLYYDEVEYTVPNELGIPVTLSLIVPAKVSSNLNFKVQVLTSTMDAKWTIGFFSGMQAAVSVQSQFDPHGFRMGTLITARLPLNFDIYIRSQIVEFSTSESFDAFTFHSTPVTFINNQAKVMEFNEPLKYEERIGYDYFGIGATIDTSIDPHCIDPNLISVLSKVATSGDDINVLYEGFTTLQTFFFWNPTFGRMTLNIHVEPSSENPTTSFRFNSFSLEKKSLHDFTVGFRLDADGPTARYWNLDFKIFSEENAVEETFSGNFNFKRGPIPNYDENGFQMCFDLDSHVKKESIAVLDPMSRKVDPVETLTGKLTYGLSCESKEATKIIIEGSGKLSSRNKDFVKNNTKIYVDRCQQNIKFKDIEYCLLETAKSGMLGEFRADVKYTNLPQSPEDRHLYNLIQQVYSSELAVEENSVSAPIEDGQITVFTNISYGDEVVDFSFTRPGNDTRATFSMRVNDLINPADLPTSLDIGRFKTGLFASQKATCYFSETKFSTFDQVEYKYGVFEDETYHVLMTHCPTQTFSLRIRHTEGSGLELTFNIHSMELNVYPSRQKMTVTGRRLIGQEYCSSTHCTLRNQQGLVYITAKKTDDSNGFYLSSEPFKFNMFFNGRIGILSISDLYKGSVCGLCGQFNGEKIDELTGPDGTIYNSAEDFVQSYETSTS